MNEEGGNLLKKEEPSAEEIELGYVESKLREF